MKTLYNIDIDLLTKQLNNKSEFGLVKVEDVILLLNKMRADNG